MECFARDHAAGGADGPAQAKYYRRLLPAAPPGPGQQYAFEVDLDQCSGCKACVTACHSLNGLDEDETWREVGLLHSDDWRAPFQATVTTACHHCVDPGCLSGCPVLAYDKDPVTGIVRHLDDQCIGCQYCVMKCPYEVPKYSARRGIVRKCDLCSNRLAQGEAPACVQACPSQAIRITVADQAILTAQFRATPAAAGNTFLPTAPRPALTVPTTRYRSARPLPAAVRAGDQRRVAPAHGHPPLVFMLVLSQLSVGALTVGLFLPPSPAQAGGGALLGIAALGLGSLHLGRPTQAWRAFLGWRTSWFSREVIAFGAFIPLAVGAAIAPAFPALAGLQPLLGVAAAVAGWLGVGCSAMLYADTHREFWNLPWTAGKFFGTAALLGLAFTLAVRPGVPHPGLLCALVFVTLGKLALEQRIFRWQVDRETPAPTALNRTARLLTGELSVWQRWRIAAALLGGGLLPLLGLLLPAHLALIAGTALACLLVGEACERHLFFTAVAPDKMPGGFTT